MKIDPVTMTAFAVGELTLHEGEKIEQTIRQSPELLEEVRATEALAQRLRIAFAAEPAPELDGKARRTLDASAERAAKTAGPRFALSKILIPITVTGIAAAILLGPVIPALIHDKKSAEIGNGNISMAARKLQEVVIPRLVLRNASLFEAISKLQLESQKNDRSNSQNPGIPMVIHASMLAGNPLERPKEPQITLNLENISVDGALKLITDQAGYDYRILQGSVALVPKPKQINDATKGLPSEGKLSVGFFYPNHSRVDLIPGLADTTAKLDQIRHLLLEAKGFYDTGRHDLAKKRYEEVLNLDRYNIAARRGIEELTFQKNRYAETAYDATRAELLWQVQQRWELPVRKIGRSENASPGAELPIADKTAGSATVTGNLSNSGSFLVAGNLLGNETDRSTPAAESREAGENSLRAKIDSPGAESYSSLTDNAFASPLTQPLSTFSIDVDTASYANIRRYLKQHALPPKEAVRIEEMINSFTYDYPQPKSDAPFAVDIEAGGCPWQPDHRLARIAIQGRFIDPAKRPPANLVFLVDVSGSMSDENKLPLAKQALRLLASQLNENDRIAIVTYAGNESLALPGTHGADKKRILDAIDRLGAGGSTNGARGIQLAYDVAAGHFTKEAANRVILLTDGDFNVGITDQSQLQHLIEEKAKTGVFLSVLGFGMGNLKDSTLEMLADKGNGNYAYIDSFKEARKVFSEQLAGALVTIAKDVKLQVEFNPAQVESYRLIGYENRLLAKEDFDNDAKDAGEIGAGASVTALYEIIPQRAGEKNAELKYQNPVKSTVPNDSKELLTLKLRYKLPNADRSELLEYPVVDNGKNADATSDDFRFASSVAAFGMVLRDSPHKGNASLPLVLELAHGALGKDSAGYRAEFIDLVLSAKKLFK